MMDKYSAHRERAKRRRYRKAYPRQFLVPGESKIPNFTRSCSIWAKEDVHLKKAAFIAYTEKAQLTFLTQDVSKAFGKPDAPYLFLIPILSCALVVGC